MKSEFIVTFSSSDQQAARDGILFALTEVDSAYATGPISHVTTNLLEQMGYLAPNAFGGRTIDPEVDELFSAALEIFNKSEQAGLGRIPYVGRSIPHRHPHRLDQPQQHRRKTYAAFARGLLTGHGPVHGLDRRRKAEALTLCLKIEPRTFLVRGAVP